ncbi:MAG: starch-binding protein [Ruminococcus sp.]|nr:starch-binding protein [Ruminococcus sp.]
MAVGMAVCNTNSSNEPVIDPKNMSGNRAFSVAGVRGVYTAKSDTKKLVTASGNYVLADGSDEIPKADYDANPAAYAGAELMTMLGLTDMTDMDSSGAASTTWTYTQQYYPQISSMMVADLTKSSIKQVDTSDIDNNISGKNAAGSVFFISDSGTSPSGDTTITTATVSAYKKPVLSLASVQPTPIGDPYDVTDDTTGNRYTKQDYKPQVQTDFVDLTAAAQMSEVVKAYRYSQAATATVFLDHWDLTMNTKTGDADKQDSDHVPSLDRNAMQRSGTMQINGKDVALWSITYTHLSADKYSFKVNAGDSMAFSYGKEGFAKSDDACELEVAVPNSDATIYFAFNGLNTDYYALYADVTTPSGETTRQTWHTPPAEYQEDPTPYILAGGFEGNGATNAETGVTLPNWKEKDVDGAGTARLRYDASLSDDDNRIYKLAVNCPAGTYEFKVTHSTWADESQWGADGVPAGSNMSLKLVEDAQVTFLFNENTKKLTMQFDNANKAVAYNCGEHFVKREGGGVEGFSVLAHSEQIGVNAHWYVNSPEGLEAAARAGLMDPNSDETEYTYHFTLSGNDMWSKNYAYKIIKDGVDEGPNQCFYLDTPPDSGAPSSLNLTIHYFPNNIGNARFSVTCDDEEIASLISIDDQSAHYDSYGLSGVSELFGDSWLTSPDYLMGVDSEDEGIFKYSFDEINFRYLGYTDGQLPAGSYSFKVVAGNTWESGLDYGDAKGGNYTFNLVQPADKVTVRFDPSSEADCKITIDVNPPTALDTKNYVITASAAFASVLGVEEWKKNYEDAQPAFMLFNNGTQRFEKWVYDVTPNDNVTLDEWGDEGYPIWCYGFKVIPVGNDDNKPNLLIELTKMRTSYDLYIAYDETTDQVLIYAFDHTGFTHDLTEADGYAIYNRSTGELISKSESQDYLVSGSLEPAFYTILGEEALTEYNWSGNYLPSARRGLLVPANDGTGRLHLSEPYRVTNIKSETEFGTSFSFKVSAGGTWDLSYPAIGNQIVTVAYPDDARSTASWNKNECDIDIFFDPDTHRVVDVTAYNGANAGSYIFELNEEELQWYVAATNKLFDQNMFSDQENVTVYDTVRDITSDFYFTYGSGSEQRGLMVESDAVRNTTDGFYNADEFGLAYSMRERYLKNEETITRSSTMEGTFTADIIDLKNRTLTHDDAVQLSGNEKDAYDGFVLSSNQLLTKFYVEQFAPGKKWLKINTVGYGYSDEYKNWQQQFLTYNNYIDDKEKFDRYEKLFLQLCSAFPYQGSKVNEFTLYAYLTERKNDTSDEVYQSMVEALDYDILYWKENLETRAANGEDREPSTVFDSNTQFIVGSRDIRLIPSSYLEAGVDANVNVVQKAGDEANATNSVRLNYNTTGYASDNYSFMALVKDQPIMDDGSYGEAISQQFTQDIDELSFGYYNYAMTSAFLSTDKVGLGIYNNYNDQKIAHYDSSGVRDDDDPNVRNSSTADENNDDLISLDGHRYFAMSSTYNTKPGEETERDKLRYNYNDTAEFGDPDNVSRRTSVNLNAGYFNNMSIIGSTYDRNQTDEKEDAQVLVKIFKVNTDENGNHIMNPDGSYSTTPVYFSNNTNATTAYASNYKKWSGLANFTAADTGYYEVQFNWVLSDGRYMQDSKYVDIKLVEPGITKTVNTEYETAGDNMLTYTIKYTNFNTELLVDFAILDILPFDGDVRYNPASGRINSTNLADSHNDLKFKLKAVTVQQSSKSDVREIYFTNSEQVKNWLQKTTTEDGETFVTTNEEAAKNLTLSESGFIEDSDGVSWTPLGHAEQSLQKYAPGRYTTFFDGGSETTLDNDATAVCISGMQLATGQEITVEFTFAFEGEITDYYSNDAFYYIRATEATNTEDAGMSRPVGTAIVSRDLTGFAWLDNDGDGIIDSNESKLQNMEVQLYRQIQVTNPDTGVTSSNYVDTGSRTTTDTNGFYKFSNIESGYYEVRFMSPTDGDLYVVGNDSKQVAFTDLRGTTKLREVNERRSEPSVITNGYTTRNLAVATQTNPEQQIEAEKRFTYAISGIYMPSNSLVYSNNNNKTMTNATDENYLYTRLFQNAGFSSIWDIGYQYSIDIDKTNDAEEKLEGVKFLAEFLNPNDGLWYPVKYKTVAEGTALETKVMDTNFTTPGTLGDYTADSWGTAVVEQFEAEEVPTGNYRTAYVVDKTGSDFINMHYWGDSVNTSWPGVELRRVVTNTTGGNVYVAYIPEGTNGVIFNNKEGDNGLQTSNIEGDALKTTDTIYTLTSEDGKIGCEGSDASSFREVYFVNTQGWENVYAYGWGGTYSVGDWPGYPMRQLTDTLWSTLIPTDMTGLIFNNNNGSQTVDITYSTLTGSTVFALSSEKDGNKYRVNTDIVSAGTKRVYFVNSPEWSSVSLHRWGGATAGTDWPGMPMTRIDDTEIYYVDIPDDTTGVIFNNNGSGEQTANIEGTIGKIYRTTGLDGENRYTTTEVYSGNTSAEDNPNRNIYFTNNYGWTGKIYVQTIGGANPSGAGGIEMTLDHTNDYGEEMYVASVPKDTEKLVFFNIKTGESARQNQTTQIDYSNEVQGWYITGREVNGEVTINEGDYYYTDAEGNISLPKLIDGRYRITEIETLDDYVLFGEPIEFNLPYTISTDLLAQSNADYALLLNEDYIESQDEEYIRYKHLGMNVVNHKEQFDLPLTGKARDNLLWNLLIGLALFLLGSIAFILVFKKRDKLQAVTLPAKNLIPHNTDKRE